MKKFTLVFIVLIAAFAAQSIAQIKEGPKKDRRRTEAGTSRFIPHGCYQVVQGS